MPVNLPARRYKRSCRDLYERIVAKGKSKKLALIAVCNTLFKKPLQLQRQAGRMMKVMFLCCLN